MQIDRYTRQLKSEVPLSSLTLIVMSRLLHVWYKIGWVSNRVKRDVSSDIEKNLQTTDLN